MYYDVTKFIKKEVFKTLVELLPTPRQKQYGRKRVEKESLITGILQVLKHGIPWNQIAPCGASGVSCWRYFQEVQRRGKLKLIYESLAVGGTDVVEGSIDTTTATSFNFRRLCGYDGKHRKYGTKISLFSDRSGLPVDVAFGKGQTYDGVFVAGHLKKTAGRRKRVINFDKMYTNLEMRRRLRKSGTRVNMEMRKGDYIRKRGPKFSFDKEKYQVRFLIERLNAWIKNFWRVRVRRDYKPAIYKAFVYLALIIVLLRQN